MLQLRSPSTARVALGLASLFLSTLSTLALGGCTAGVMSSNNPGSAGANGPGSGGSAGSSSGLGGFNLGGHGGSTSTGTGGTLPVPPGCGDGINNQGGIEQCDDGNTL